MEQQESKQIQSSNNDLSANPSPSINIALIVMLVVILLLLLSPMFVSIIFIILGPSIRTVIAIFLLNPILLITAVCLLTLGAAIIVHLHKKREENQQATEETKKLSMLRIGQRISLILTVVQIVFFIIYAILMIRCQGSECSASFMLVFMAPSILVFLVLSIVLTKLVSKGQKRIEDQRAEETSNKDVTSIDTKVQ